MVDALTHPAADRDTPEALVVEQDRAVVPMSSWLTDAAVQATSSGRVLQVLTPPHSRLTYPLELLLGESQGQWVVRDGPEAFRDGFTGVPMRWNGARFSPDDGAAPALAPVGAGGLEVQITTLHQPSSVELGVSTETAVRALTEAGPTGWGSSEPVTEPWSPREITRYCHQRSPDPTNLVVVGGTGERAVVGSLRIRRVDTGLSERLRLAGPVDTAVSQEAIDLLAAAVASSARTMIVASHPGRHHGLRSATPTPPALPYAILLGRDIVNAHGAEHARQAPAAHVRLLGLAGHQACWCRFDDGEATPYDQLTEVLHHFNLT